MVIHAVLDDTTAAILHHRETSPTPRTQAELIQELIDQLSLLLTCDSKKLSDTVYTFCLETAGPVVERESIISPEIHAPISLSHPPLAVTTETQRPTAEESESHVSVVNQLTTMLGCNPDELVSIVDELINRPPSQEKNPQSGGTYC